MADVRHKLNENIEDRHSEAHEDFDNHISKVKDPAKKRAFKKDFTRHSNAFSKHYDAGNDEQADEALGNMQDVVRDVRSHVKNLQETASSETLSPGKGSGGTDSRAQMTATFVQLLNQLGKEDLSDLFDRTLAQIGHEADSVPGSAEANRATVAAKSVKEDLDDLFSGDELSEEMREKTSVIFEAAVNTRMGLEVARLEEEFDEAVATLEEQFEQQLQEQANTIFEDLAEKIDQYMNYVVEQWMVDNQIAIESSLRTEIAEGFIAGLQNLFAEHYIAVPDEQLDILGELKAENDQLREALNTTLDEKIQLESVVVDATKSSLIEEISEGLAATQVEKLKTLSEGLEFTDVSTYRRKLEIVKENYFSTNKTASNSTGLITEEIDGSDETDSDKGYAAPQIGKYMEAISKSVK